MISNDPEVYDLQPLGLRVQVGLICSTSVALALLGSWDILWFLVSEVL
jgi:hypothetical protein